MVIVFAFQNVRGISLLGIQNSKIGSVGRCAVWGGVGAGCGGGATEEEMFSGGVSHMPKLSCKTKSCPRPSHVVWGTLKVVYKNMRLFTKILVVFLAFTRGPPKGAR